MIKHVFIIGYIVLACILINRLFKRFGVDNFILELMASWVVLTMSIYVFGAYLVYFK